jgi:hypothetical protein
LAGVATRFPASLAKEVRHENDLTASLRQLDIFIAEKITGADASDPPFYSTMPELERMVLASEMAAVHIHIGG